MSLKDPCRAAVAEIGKFCLLPKFEMKKRFGIVAVAAVFQK